MQILALYHTDLLTEYIPQALIQRQQYKWGKYRPKKEQ